MLGVKIMEKVFCLETISSANWWLLSLLRRGMATPICTKLQTTQMNFLENRLMSVWHTLFFRKYHTQTDRERGGAWKTSEFLLGLIPGVRLSRVDPKQLHFGKTHLNMSEAYQSSNPGVLCTENLQAESLWSPVGYNLLFSCLTPFVKLGRGLWEASKFSFS